MASTINASTSGVGGVITTADNSGVLELQAAGVTRATVNGNGVNVTGTVYANSDAISPFSSGFKNKIIGGDFSTNPWQRRTSFTSVVSGSYTADRFGISYTSTAVVSVLKTVDAPLPATIGLQTLHCLHVDVTTADSSIATNDFMRVFTRIEGLNAISFGFGQSGTRYVTLSFWHKHTKTGTYCVAFRNAVVDRSYVAEYTQDVTDTWEKATITIQVDNTETWKYDTGIGLEISFALAGGTLFQTTANTWAAGNFLATANQVNALDSTSNNFKIALVQLEAGATATPFETRSVGQELALCQRYYYKLNAEGAGAAILANGFVNTTTNIRAAIPFQNSMRIAPTALEQSGVAADYTILVKGTATVNCSAVPTFATAAKNLAQVQFTVASGVVAGEGCQVRAGSAGNTAYLAFSAEL